MLKAMKNLIRDVTAPRKKVYPKHMNGAFHRLRSKVSVLLQALLFIGPWLSWGDHQAILLDIPGRKLSSSSFSAWFCSRRKPIFSNFCSSWPP